MHSDSLGVLQLKFISFLAGCLSSISTIAGTGSCTLDVTFHEDESKVRVQNAPKNLNVLRKVAMALMRSTPTAKKGSAKGKMFRAALSTSFLEQALFAPPGP